MLECDIFTLRKEGKADEQRSRFMMHSHIPTSGSLICLSPWPPRMYRVTSQALLILEHLTVWLRSEHLFLPFLQPPRSNYIWFTLPVAKHFFPSPQRVPQKRKPTSARWWWNSGPTLLGMGESCDKEGTDLEVWCSCTFWRGVSSQVWVANLLSLWPQHSNNEG